MFSLPHWLPCISQGVSLQWHEHHHLALIPTTHPRLPNIQHELDTLKITGREIEGHQARETSPLRLSILALLDGGTHGGTVLGLTLDPRSPRAAYTPGYHTCMCPTSIEPCVCNFVFLCFKRVPQIVQDSGPHNQNPPPDHSHICPITHNSSC